MENRKHRRGVSITITHNNVSEATMFQKLYMVELQKRIEKIMKGEVSIEDDNPIHIISDGIRCALDQRLIDPELPYVIGSRVDKLVDNIFRVYHDYDEQKLVQLVYCDIATYPRPMDNKKFNIYKEVMKNLVDMGIPEDEIFNSREILTAGAKKRLPEKLKDGSIRIFFINSYTPTELKDIDELDSVIAMHMFQNPYGEYDMKKLEKFVRQHSRNETGKVHMFRYVTKDTMDEVLKSLVEEPLSKRIINKMISA